MPVQVPVPVQRPMEAQELAKRVEVLRTEREQASEGLLMAKLEKRSAGQRRDPEARSVAWVPVGARGFPAAQGAATLPEAWRVCFAGRTAGRPPDRRGKLSRRAPVLGRERGRQEQARLVAGELAKSQNPAGGSRLVAV